MKKKICFMHIPKTAGSSVNDYFSEVFGDDKSLTFAEHSIYSGQSINKLLDNYEYLSGHLFYGNFSEIKRKVILFTILRDPYEQIVSQLKWLNRYNLPSYDEERSCLSDDVQKLVAMIGKISLESVHELDELLSNLPPVGYHLLNNVQSRFIIGDSGNNRPLSIRDIGYVSGNLKKFDHVCTMNEISEAMPNILELAGHKKRKFNYHSNRGSEIVDIDISNPLVRSVLQKHILLDSLLYEIVCKRSN